MYIAKYCGLLLTTEVVMEGLLRPRVYVLAWYILPTGGALRVVHACVRTHLPTLYYSLSFWLSGHFLSLCT